DPGRAWRISQDLGVNVFHTAPTAIRALRKIGPEEPAKYDFSFKHMTTVGEPIEPEVWRWYEREVGKSRAVVCDTYWQTETGGFLCSTVPALQPMKPGSVGPGVPGIHPAIFDEEGNALEHGAGVAGNICIRNPWPGCMQTVWGDRDRFVESYFGRYNNNRNSQDWRDWPYLTGDAGVIASDGYLRVLGRVDDVINVSGHRLGSKEIESAALTVKEVAEAAVVPVNSEIKGKEPEIYVSIKPGYESVPEAEIQQKVADAINSEIGKIARCRNVWIVPDMPKTRSGKIMRRILASISNEGDVGNVMTLANPEIVQTIKKTVIG
ncbi:MAG: acetyl-coenzyme A synthetase, partial [Deltaproteobacteria bacterium]